MSSRMSHPPAHRKVRDERGTTHHLVIWPLRMLTGPPAVHFVAGGPLVTAGCGEPTPFEPATCLASGFGAASLWGGGGVLGYLGVHTVEDELIPGIKQAVTCTP